MVFVVEQYKESTFFGRQVLERIHSQDGPVAMPAFIYKFEHQQDAVNYIEGRLNDPTYRDSFSYELFDVRRLALFTETIKREQVQMVDYTQVKIHDG